MDIRPTPAALSPSEAQRRLTDQVLAGGDAVLDGPGAAAVLDAAAEPLAARRCRVLRASAYGPGGLRVSGLVAQVTGKLDLEAQDDASLEQGTRALTALDGACDQVVLLVAGAGRFELSGLRYLQLACRTSASLRLVLAGMPNGLDAPEFAYLRTRLHARPMLALADTVRRSAAPQAPVQPVAAPGQAAVPPRMAVMPSDRPRMAATGAPGWVRPVAALLVLAGFAGFAAFAGRGQLEPARLAGTPAPIQLAGPALNLVPEPDQAASAGPAAALSADAPVPAQPAPGSPLAAPHPGTMPMVPTTRRLDHPRLASRRLEARIPDTFPSGTRRGGASPHGIGRAAVPPSWPDRNNDETWTEGWGGATRQWRHRDWQPDPMPWRSYRDEGYAGGNYAGIPYYPER